MHVNALLDTCAIGQVFPNFTQIYYYVNGFTLYIYAHIFHFRVLKHKKMFTWHLRNTPPQCISCTQPQSFTAKDLLSVVYALTLILATKHLKFNDNASLSYTLL